MKSLIFLCLTIALLLAGCNGVNQIANGAESTNLPLNEESNLSIEADIQKLQQELSELKTRVVDIEEAIKGDIYENPWVISSIEDRLDQIEDILGIGKLEWPSASLP